MIAWMFPGQGSQRPGMAAGLSACEELYPAARSILGFDLEPICTRTARSAWKPETIQPAILLTSVGATRSLQSVGVAPAAVAGHSLGEFAAAVAAGVLDFEDALRLVWIRSKTMTAAGRANPGGMAAVLGIEGPAVEKICADGSGVWVANFNSELQTVISGTDEGLAEAAQACSRAGAKVVRLDVPVAAHTPLMEPARHALAKELANVKLREPAVPFYSAVDTARHDDPDEIASVLTRGITAPVRFAETITAMHADGVSGFVEVGPGTTLKGLVRRIVKDVSIAGAQDDGEIEALAFSIGRLAPT